MARIISVINEGSTGYLSVAFYDKANLPALPSSISYTVRCLTTGTVLRAPTSLTPATSIEILLSPSDNAIQQAGNPYETRLVTVSASYGASDAINDDYTYQVRNLVGV